MLEWVAMPGDLPNPGIEPRSPTLQADSLPAEPLGKSKNTGVGSLSLLQKIFPTHKSNQSLLRYRWILYQLSYEGSPGKKGKSGTKVRASVCAFYSLLGSVFLVNAKLKGPWPVFSGIRFCTKCSSVCL